MRKSLLIVLIFGVAIGLFLRELLPKKPAAAKVVTVKSRNLEYQVATMAKTVGELLLEQNLPDSIPYRPSASRVQNDNIVHGMTIEISKPLEITLIDGGNEQRLQTQAATVADLLYEQKIALSATDQVKPDFSSFLTQQQQVVIDRIVDLEAVELNELPYSISLEYDPEALYGREEVLIPGKLGQKQQIFLITYKNGVEVKRKLLREKILESPSAELRKFGTKIEIEEVREGRASWYAYKKCMCAAHPFYDKGRYVRVTSLNSGKTIIVRINDRGPDLSVHPERVIDLDSTAYKELAALGSGTIPVRVELLKN